MLDAAILIEANWLPLVDEVWLVVGDRDTVIERLCAKGFSKEQALSRIESQLSDDERKKYADVIIENTGSISDVEKRVSAVWKEAWDL